MALPHCGGEGEITTNTHDRAHSRHNEIKLKELRAIKLPSGIVVMPTIGCKRTKKKKPFGLCSQKMWHGISNEAGTEGIILNHSLFSNYNCNLCAKQADGRLGCRIVTSLFF